MRPHVDSAWAASLLAGVWLEEEQRCSSRETSGKHSERSDREAWLEQGREPLCKEKARQGKGEREKRKVLRKVPGRMAITLSSSDLFSSPRANPLGDQDEIQSESDR